MKHEMTIFGEKYNYTGKTQLEMYQELCYRFYKHKGLLGLCDYIGSLLTRMFPDVESPFTEEDKADERTLLDICIEQYTFGYFLSKENPRDYIALTLEKKLEAMKDDKLLHLLLTYKMEKYGKEILQSIGLQLVEKVEEGYIVRDTDDTGGAIAQ